MNSGLKIYIRSFLKYIVGGTVGATLALLVGCKTDENHGLTLIVGDHFALPKLTQESSNTELEIYEATEGAMVKCRKDCKVTATYDMACTNHIALLWDKITFMKLSVTAEPLATDPSYEVSEANASELGASPTPSGNTDDE